jgi:glycosyltransferase involved in cell wall biosynthesis
LISRSFAMVTTFFPPENFGGDGIFVQRLAHGLASRGHRVTVIADHDAYRISGGRAEAPPIETEPFRVVRLKSPFGPLSPIATQLTGRPVFKSGALEEALSSERFDIVHFHNVSLVGGPGVLALGGGAARLYTLHEHWLLCPTHVFWKEKSRLCDEKTCFSCQIRSGRPPQLWRYGSFLRESLENVDLFLAPSRFTADKHRAEGVTRPIRVLPHFIPDAPARAEVPREPVFFYGGRLDLSKGPDALLAAARGLEAKVRIAGEGPLREELERSAREVPNVTVLGRLPAQEVGAELAGARAVVLPSRCLETFGLTAAEAMMRGVPVVARRRGALTEIVEESGGGLLFEEDSELPEILWRLAGDPGLAAELGRRGRAAAQRLWREESHIGAYLQQVEEVLASKRPSSS